MTGESRVSLRPAAAAVVAMTLILAGGGLAFVLLRGDRPPAAVVPPEAGAQGGHDAHASGSPAATPAAPASPGERVADVVVPMSADATKRAGITTAPVTVRAASTAVRIPGVVEPNAYRQVAVTPLVSGRLISVAVDLGERVRRGQNLAAIYSPELAEAQTRYISARAELEAHDRALQRTERLVEIGAASRQELERIHAEHTAQTANVQSARTKLELLGVPDAALEALAPGRAVDATTSVPAPIDGIVTERVANPGLNVDPSMKLFTVVDLSTVWVLADLYERDFVNVQVGSQVTVTTSAYPALSLRGHVSYIDPQVNLETRTARLRVEVQNARGELRLGMFADVLVGTDRTREVVIVPRGAVQNVGSRTVVYLANPSMPGRFIERDVTVGRVASEDAEIESGLRLGDVVVTGGSFFVRAERERLGLRSAGTPGASALGNPAPAAVVPASSPAPPSAGRASGPQTASIRVTTGGFEPDRLTLRPGMPARVTFTRVTNETCATAVVFPSLGIKRELPLNQPVSIEFMPTAGELSFACGMNMFKGTVVVK